MSHFQQYKICHIVYCRNNDNEHPPRRQRPGPQISAKTAKIRRKRHPFKPKCKKRPRAKQ